MYRMPLLHKTLAKTAQNTPFCRSTVCRKVVDLYQVGVLPSKFQDRRFQPLTHSSVFNSNVFFELAANLLHFGFRLQRSGPFETFQEPFLNCDARQSNHGYSRMEHLVWAIDRK